MLPAKECFERIAERDGEIGAFVALAGDVGTDGRRGPLEGAGVAIKDLYRVDGLPTLAGSTLPAEVFDGPQSPIVSDLEAAGAVVLGKTAMDEFAFCEPPPTKNPLDPRRTPGGSSGGSAAAVASGMCDFAVGSQTLQSTIVPAAYCGVVGYKPSFGRLSFDGIPLSPSIDTVGFLSRSVGDMTVAVRALGIGARSVDEVVLGVPEPWGLRAHAPGWNALSESLGALGGTFGLVDCRVPWNDDLASWATTVRQVVEGEMARVHDRWFDRYGDRYRVRTREAIERGGTVTDDALAASLSALTAGAEAVDELMHALAVDAFVCPSVGDVAPLGYDITGDSWMTCFWSALGMPCVSLPIAGDGAMPLGLQLVGRRGDDEGLLGVAEAVERALLGVY